MSGYFKYIDGYYEEYIVTGWLENMEQKDVQGGEHFSGSNRGDVGSIDITLTKPVYDSCALMRTDLARVRCVRKQ